MNPAFKKRLEFAEVQLIRMAAPRLTDDMRVSQGKLPYVPLKVATATIGECLAAKVMHA